MDQQSAACGRLVCPEQPSSAIPALFFHDLTGTVEADRLLNVPPLFHPATLEVIPRLSRFHEETAAKLSPKNNNPSRIPFKLISRQLIWASEDVDSFVAISYCWHNDEWTVPDGYFAGHADWNFPFSPAMLKAVLHCIGERTALWIDQICIDQTDAGEKAHTIANMDTIYRNARRVLILLEDIDMGPEQERAFGILADNASEESVLVKEEHVTSNISTCNATGGTDDLVAFFGNTLFYSRWFSRAWCNQEYYLNENRTFILVGHKYQCVALDPIFAQFQAEVEEAGYDAVEMTDNHVYANFGWGMALRKPEEMIEASIFELFSELATLSSSFLGDLVSIALNTSGLSLSFNSTVGSLGECQFILALIALAAGDGSVLGIEGSPLEAERAFDGMSLGEESTIDDETIIRWPSNFDLRWSGFVSSSMSKLCAEPRIYKIERDHFVMGTMWHRRPVSLNEGRGEQFKVIGQLWTLGEEKKDAV